MHVDKQKCVQACTIVIEVILSPIPETTDRGLEDELNLKTTTLGLEKLFLFSKNGILGVGMLWLNAVQTSIFAGI